MADGDETLVERVARKVRRSNYEVGHVIASMLEFRDGRAIARSRRPYQQTYLGGFMDVSDHIPELRAIPDFPDYAASVDGGIWRVTRTKRPNKCGEPPYRLNTSVDNNGYRVLRISDENGQISLRKAHRLVCMAFHGSRPTAAHEVAHYDGNPRNNNADNLRWATKKENSADSIRHGTLAASKRLGRLHPNAILTEDQVRYIRANVKKRGDITRIARELELTFSTVYQAAVGLRWAWLTTTAH